MLLALALLAAPAWGADVCTSAIVLKGEKGSVLSEAEGDANFEQVRNLCNVWTPSTGLLTHEKGGLEADVSAYSGLLGVDSGAAQEVDTLGELNALLGSSVADGAHSTDDQVASEVAFTPTGGIAASDVQGALAEVDSEHTVDTTLSQEEVEDFASSLLTSSSGTEILASYDDAGGAVDLDLDEAAVESGLEAVLDLQDLQGAVTDSQVPDDVTIDLASTATALAANGTNCDPGDAARGVDASGNAEGCFTPAGGGGGQDLYIYMSVAALAPDGTNCSAPEYTQIGGGPLLWTVVCLDSNSSTLYGSVRMPDDWDGGDLVFALTYVQTAANNGSVLSDVAAQCRGAGEAINDTWSAEAAIDDAAVTGSGAQDTTESAAVTPNGTCAAGDLVNFRWQWDSASTTLHTSLHILGMSVRGSYQ